MLGPSVWGLRASKRPRSSPPSWAKEALRAKKKSVVTHLVLSSVCGGSEKPLRNMPPSSY
eukprot:1163960-Pyramimonas_sp.AAC.1